MSTLSRGKDSRGRDVFYADSCKVAGGPWSNFAGREVRDNKTGQIVNAEGVRNFTIIVDNEHDIDLLREESVNFKMSVNDRPDEDDGITEARVRVKVKIDSGNPPLEIWIRTGMKDENGKYVEPFKKFNVKRIAELDSFMFDTADFTLGISRRNATHALYLNQAFFTITYSPNPLELKYAGMIENDSYDDDAEFGGGEEENPFD